MNKQQYNIKDTVWIHIGEPTLIKGRVVEIIDFEHLDEGHNPDREFYIVEIKTGIDDIYEVRDWDQISSTAQGPINVFNNLATKNADRFLKKIGIKLPGAPTIDIDRELDDPTADQIHAAIERSEKSSRHQPMVIAAPAKPKRRNFKKKPL